MSVRVAEVPYLIKPSLKCVRDFIPVRASTVADAVAESTSKLQAVGFSKFVVHLNGHPVQDLGTPVADGDFVTVSVDHGVPAAAITAMITAIAGSAAATATAVAVTGFIVNTVLITGIGMLVNTFLAPPTPDLPEQSENNSSSYTFAAKNPVSGGNPIPVIFGNVRQTPSIFGSYRELVWNSDTEQYDTWQYLMLCLGFGEISEAVASGDVYIGDEPLTSFVDYSFSTTSGALVPTDSDKDNIEAAGFGKTYHDRSLDKLITYSSWEAPLTDPDALMIETFGMTKEIAITITYPKGLFWTDSNGFTRWISAVYGSGVVFAVYALDNDVLKGTWIFDDDADVTKTWRTQHWIALPYRAMWKIVIKRTTPDDPVEYSDDTKWRMYTESVITGFQEVMDVGQSYPGVRLGLLGVRAAENVSGSLGTVTVEQNQESIAVRGTVVAGEFVDTGTTLVDPRNPAWAAYDMFTNRYSGRGISPTKLNYTRWKEWADWCDAVIYDLSSVAHTRCRCNVVLEARASLSDQIKHIEDVGRARIVRSGDEWYPIVDMPRVATYTFSAGNMTPGSFVWESYEDPEKVDAIDVAFWDKNRKFKKNTVRAKASWFETLDYPPNVAGIQLRACNDKDEATRHAIFRMNKTELVTRHGTFRAGLDAIQCERGDVVNIIHPTNIYGWGGKLARDHTAANTIYLDQYITLTTATYSGKLYLFVVDPDGTYSEFLVTGPFDVETQTITISGSYTGSRFDTYSLGRPNDEKLLYQITDRKFVPSKEEDLEEIEFSFSEYVEDMFYYKVAGVHQYRTTAGGATGAPI